MAESRLRLNAPASARRLLFLSTLVFIFYSSYRYPFQINFSGTSQVYSDTPLLLQIGKFAIALAVCLYAVARYRVAAFDLNGRIFILWLSGLIVFSTLRALFGDREFLNFSFWPLVALLLCTISGPVHLRHIDAGIKGLFFVSTVVELVQIALFFIYGRLPALAWEGSLSIRFGSFLDDPNGFAALCFLFLGWSVCRPTWAGRTSLTTLSIALILLSQSLTAIVVLIPLVLVWLLAGIVRRPIYLAFWLPLIAIALIAEGPALALSFIEEVIAYKQGSIDMHASFTFADLVRGGWSQAFFGATDYEFYESWWAQALYNWGGVWTLGLFALAVIGTGMMGAKGVRLKATKHQGAIVGMFLFMAYVIVGSFNLPFFIIFPINYLFFAALSLLLLGRLTIGDARRHGVTVK